MSPNRRQRLWHCGPQEECRRPSLIQIGFDPAGKQFLRLFAYPVLRAIAIALTMGENDRINPFAAADTAPIERSDFEYLFPNHEPAATMAAIHAPFLPNEGHLLFFDH